jgi:hypothetical protein
VFDELETSFGAQDADYFGETIGGRAVRSNDVHQSMIGKANASSRIDDMGIAFTIDFETLVKVA